MVDISSVPWAKVCALIACEHEWILACVAARADRCYTGHGDAHCIEVGSLPLINDSGARGGNCRQVPKVSGENANVVEDDLFCFSDCSFRAGSICAYLSQASACVVEPGGGLLLVHSEAEDASSLVVVVHGCFKDGRHGS